MRRILARSGEGWRDALLTLDLPDEEFERRFGTEEACRDFLFDARWPNGFECRFCGPAAFVWVGNRRLRCRRCARMNFLTAGTILHRTRKPLSVWFKAAFMVVQRGCNARVLEADLDLNHKVAWMWAHKLRKLMARKTTLDAPVPSFEEAERRREKLETERQRARWFAAHGAFRWQGERLGGTRGTCCERVESLDWDHRTGPGALVDFARWRMFRDYSGHVSEKHLRAYLDEAEFRLNRRDVPIRESAVELLRRFAEERPYRMAEIQGPRRRRPPLVLWGA